MPPHMPSSLPTPLTAGKLDLHLPNTHAHYGVTSEWTPLLNKWVEDYYQVNVPGRATTTVTNMHSTNIVVIEETFMKRDDVSESCDHIQPNAQDMDDLLTSWSTTVSTCDIDMFSYDSQPMICRSSTNILLIENSGGSHVDRQGIGGTIPHAHSDEKSWTSSPRTSSQSICPHVSHKST